MSTSATLANAFIAYLAQPLQEGGSETTIYLSTITTLTGEVITTADFARMGRGVITINPRVADSIEFASFTAVDAGDLALTTAVRGLSAVGNDSSTDRMPYHPIGTLVIITFGVHNIADILDYVDNVLAGNVGNASTTVAGVTKLSTAPASPTEPIAAGTNDTRIPTQGENDALAGGGEIGTPSSSNKFITEAIGAVKGKVALLAGETINGATLPVPVYQNDSDNEFYACDANDTAKLKFLGFAITNGTDGAALTVQFTGIVGGFTGLSEGEKYYVQDTVGTIGTTAGTTEVLVGVAISETQIMIQKGSRYANGSGVYSDAGSAGATQTTVVTTGFRPSRIRMGAIMDDGSTLLVSSSGSWVNGLYGGIYGSLNGVNSFSNAIIRIIGGGDYWTVTITSVIDTGFTITVVQNENTPLPMAIEWEAEGEL